MCDIGKLLPGMSHGLIVGICVTDVRYDPSCQKVGLHPVIGLEICQKALFSRQKGKVLLLMRFECAVKNPFQLAKTPGVLLSRVFVIPK